MKDDDLTALDRRWNKEREKYTIYSLRTGMRDEPMNPSLLLLLLVVGFCLSVGLFVAMALIETSGDGRLIGFGVVAVIAVVSVGSPLLYLRVSLQYHKARSEYLRERAALKACIEEHKARSDPVKTSVMKKLYPFSAQAVFLFATDRYFRVMFDEENLYFIQLADQLNAHLLSMAKIDEVDRQVPESLLIQHANNMKIAIDDVASATLDAPGWFDGAHGKHVGMWRLRLNTGKKWTFQFNEPDDMHRAIDTLGAALGERVKVNARWEESRQTFVAA